MWENIILMKMASVSICCFPDNGGKPPSIDLFWRLPCQACLHNPATILRGYKMDTKPDTCFARLKLFNC